MRVSNTLRAAPATRGAGAAKDVPIRPMSELANVNHLGELKAGDCIRFGKDDTTTVSEVAGVKLRIANPEAGRKLTNQNAQPDTLSFVNTSKRLSALTGIPPAPKSNDASRTASKRLPDGTLLNVTLKEKAK